MTHIHGMTAHRAQVDLGLINPISSPYWSALETDCHHPLFDDYNSENLLRNLYTFQYGNDENYFTPFLHHGVCTIFSQKNISNYQN